MRARATPIKPGTSENPLTPSLSPSEGERGAAGRVRGNKGSSPALTVTRNLSLHNRQRLRRLDLPLLRRIAQALVRETWPDGSLELAIHVVAAPEMTRLNETFLRHQGSTDVITFDYSEKAGRASRRPLPAQVAAERTDRPNTCPALLHGEIFICADEAVAQARRYGTSWQSELVRYIVHGLLHLLGYDDRQRRARARMKRAEGAHLRSLARQFDFRRLSRKEPQEA